MKTILFLLLGGALALQAQESRTPAQRAEAAYAQGVAAEKAGDAETARKAYHQALQLNPKHANARYRLGELKLNERKIAAKGREGKLGQVMVPVLQLEEASLKEALEALTLVIEKQSNDEISPGFIVQDPSNSLEGARVSLNLKNVPAKNALDYILGQAGAKARYDEHAVVILPAGR